MYVGKYICTYVCMYICEINTYVGTECETKGEEDNGNDENDQCLYFTELWELIHDTGTHCLDKGKLKKTLTH